MFDTLDTIGMRMDKWHSLLLDTPIQFHNRNKWDYN